MKPLTLTSFTSWLESYGRASAENDPQASAELFARNAKYYETPFDEPMIGRDAIRKYWEIGAQAFNKKESTYEILSVKDNQGIAHWQSEFTDIRSGKHLILDCLFLVEFNEHGTCSEFREWWHLQTTEANVHGELI
jgi:hypothetical protein